MNAYCANTNHTFTSYLNEPGSNVYRYALIACDSYSRALWGIPLESKSKADSMAAMRILNKLIDQARIPGINKPVFGGKKPSTVFYSDAGNEFRSLRNTPVLKDHKLTIATTSDMKAFFAKMPSYIFKEKWLL